MSILDCLLPVALGKARLAGTAINRGRQSQGPSDRIAQNLKGKEPPEPTSILELTGADKNSKV